MGIQFSSWLKHPTYFLFWFFTGIIAWSFSFSSVEENSIQLSSYGSTVSEDQEFERQMAELSTANFDPEKPIVSTYDQIEETEKLFNGTLDLDPNEMDLDKQQKDFSYSDVSSDDLAYLTDYEDLKTCTEPRKYLEKALQSPKISEWTSERKIESANLPRSCITFALNSFPEVTTKKAALSVKASGSSAFATCPKPNGAPAMRGGKRIKSPTPCISSKFVNVTYNAYVDVMECLRLDPKELLPKIYNESGFYMNALGGGMDGGIGQLTGSAIEQVNSIYPKYIEQMIQAGLNNPDGACARVVKNKSLIAPVKADPGSRCSLMWPTENPLRNLVYSAILTRYNSKYVSGLTYVAGEEMLGENGKMVLAKGTSEDELLGKMKDYDIKNKLQQLGMKKVNLHQFTTMVVLAGYNSGIGTAMNAFAKYLDQRLEANRQTKSAKYNLTAAHFNFIDTKDLVKEARLTLMSSNIKPSESAKSKAEKVKRRKQLPATWANAFTKTFPEYLALKLNSYNGKSTKPFLVYGFPGYLTALAQKNKMIRDTFQSAGIDPNFCSQPDFLNVK